METIIDKSGKTIEIAIQAALDELGVDRDQVYVEVIEKPKSGFLGIGGNLARVRVSYSRSRVEKAEIFLTGLLERLKSPAVPKIEEAPDGSLKIELTGNGLGFLIGHRGDTLDAIQHIVNYAVNRGEDSPTRVTIDAENYRAKRVEALQRLAQKMAIKALKYKKNLSLEPMNSYERHIIHDALQNTPGISTRSVGVDPYRHVIVVCESARPPRNNWNAGPGSRTAPTGGRPGGGYRSGGSRSGSGGYQPGGFSRDGGARQPSGDSRTDGASRGGSFSRGYGARSETGGYRTPSPNAPARGGAPVAQRGGSFPRDDNRSGGVSRDASGAHES